MNEEFEKWAGCNGFDLTIGKHSGIYMNPQTIVANGAWQASRKQAVEEAAAICDGEGNEWDSDDLITEKNYAHAFRDRIRAMQKG